MSLLKVSYQSEDSQSLHYISSLRRKIGKRRGELGTPEKKHVVRSFSWQKRTESDPRI